MKTAKENRRTNLLALIAEHGGQVALASKLRKDPAQISQWATAAKSHRGRARGISDDMARYIEEVCKREPGWMDVDHRMRAPEGAAPTQGRGDPLFGVREESHHYTHTGLERELLSAFRRADADHRRLALVALGMDPVGADVSDLPTAQGRAPPYGASTK